MSIYNTPLEERFGKKLEELRDGKNMTREQLADQVGLNLNEQILLYRIPSAITSLTHFLLSVNTRKGIFYTNFMPIQGYFR